MGKNSLKRCVRTTVNFRKSKMAVVSFNSTQEAQLVLG